jgi:hypothetical protein
MPRDRGADRQIVLLSVLPLRRAQFKICNKNETTDGEAIPRIRCPRIPDRMFLPIVVYQGIPSIGWQCACRGNSNAAAVVAIMRPAPRGRFHRSDIDPHLKETIRMADTPVPLYNIEYRRLFPWLHLSRAFWIAADIRKLLLAGAALMLISLGSIVFDQLPFGQAQSDAEAQARDAQRWPWQQPLDYNFSIWPWGDGPLVTIASNWQIVLLPFRDIVGRASILFSPEASAMKLADAITRLLWNLAVWSIFGGAICRIAAVQFARDQQIGIRRALVFSLLRFFGYFSAPLMPLVGVGMLWILCVIGGWIGRIPAGVGEGLLGVLWGLELLFGFLMAIVLIGVMLGWPLMFATISVEGTDGFDGLSRAYNYVFERPLYFAWQALLTMIYGSLAIFFVATMAQFLTHLAVWGVSWGHPGAARFVAGSPVMIIPNPGDAGEATSIGLQIASGWMCALSVLVVGFIYTFFWSSATITYYLLRHSVDGNDFDEVFAEDYEDKDELLPLVGTAGMGEAGKQTAAPAIAVEPPPVDLTP